MHHVRKLADLAPGMATAAWAQLMAKHGGARPSWSAAAATTTSMHRPRQRSRNHWRAGCPETGTSGSVGGRAESPHHKRGTGGGGGGLNLPNPADPGAGLRRPTQGRPDRAGHPRSLPGPTDKIDAGGSVTVRHNSRLHHIGLGARLAGTLISLLIDDLHIRVIHRHTGQLIRELILDPTRDYQPRGLPPRPPKRERATPPGGIPIPAQSAARSRSQGWPKADPKGPGLDLGEDGATITSRDAETPINANDVPRHLLTVSRDITWRRMRDSNPRGLAPNPLSKRAP